MKSYIRSKVSQDLWETFSKIRRTPKSFAVDLAEDILMNIRFFSRRRKGFSSVPCLVPFMRMEFQYSGTVTACCYAFTKIKSVGDMNCQTIEEIWNGKVMKNFRKHLYMGKTSKTCMSNCDYLKLGPISFEEIRTDTEEGKSLHEDVMNGRIELRSNPLRFNLANSKICNLKCVMCRDRESEKMNSSLPEHLKKTRENLEHYFDKNITIYLTGNGDVLARRDTRELLQDFDSEKHKKVSFQILTNGLLFQPEMWEKIKHNNFTYANISMDAATRETYEKIRRGGKWEKLIDALEVFRKARAEGKFSSVNINMTVMRSNYREIPQFIEMARSRGFNALLTRVRGKWADENIFEDRNNEAIQELRTILSDPGLYDSDVDIHELAQYIPKELRSKMGNHIASIWYPSNVLKPRAS